MQWDAVASAEICFLLSSAKSKKEGLRNLDVAQAAGEITSSKGRGWFEASRRNVDAAPQRQPSHQGGWWCCDLALLQVPLG